MKIKSTKEKMRGIRFTSFSQSLAFPLDAKGNVKTPIVTKKQFRQLQAGKQIDVSDSQFKKLHDRFGGLFEVTGDENPKPKTDLPNITIEENDKK